MISIPLFEYFSLNQIAYCERTLLCAVYSIMKKWQRLKQCLFFKLWYHTNLFFFWFFGESNVFIYLKITLFFVFWMKQISIFIWWIKTLESKKWLKASSLKIWCLLLYLHYKIMHLKSPLNTYEETTKTRDFL
jgi:hypothetical protein